MRFSLMLLLLMSCSDENEINSNNEFNINLAHLDYLSEIISLDSTDVLIVYIYADAPNYERIAAEGEGITAVDDVARAALVYLKYYEQFGGEGNLEKAKKALKFVLYMQADDGKFYNFIHADHTINRDGRTSLKSFDYWSIRAIRAMSYGYKVYQSKDQEFAKQLKNAVEKTFPHIDKWMESQGQYSLTFPVNIPLWLINNAGDQSSELVLGLIDYYIATGDIRTEGYIRKLTDGLVKFQMSKGDYSGAHLSWQNLWHAWGAHQVQAISKAYTVFGEEKWLTSLTEGAVFLSKVVSENNLNELIFFGTDSVTVNKYPQIAYGIHAVSSGLMEAYLITENEEYRVSMMRGLGWFKGENIAETVMYDPSTGRTFDGIDLNGVNRNSGAESTIEALLLFLEMRENGFY
ncbi:hypothetical protein E3V33_04305 [Candidatus Marinimicrobia bacterium MT.SAG.4]|nr:hypothetical protein E3V33_04305 [Candidatus Marinimicrobia bacterium MT.SAG.4]